MELSIVILSYNTKQILKNCLDSLFQNTEGVDFEVIVVDNASTDGSAALVRKKFPKARLIRNVENLGFAKGNNKGIKISRGKYVLVLNSDTLIKKGALVKLVSFMNTHPNAGVVGPKLLNHDGTLQGSAGKFPTLPVVFTMLFKEHFGGSQLVRTSYDRISEVDWVMGAALMVRREILSKTGFLDEDIFMYYDEVEWCYRIKQAGFSVYFYPYSEIIHLWQKSSQTGRKGPILANYRGLIYFYKKHRTGFELMILRGMLKLKATLALGVGYLSCNPYLKETYAEAFKLV